MPLGKVYTSEKLAFDYIGPHEGGEKRRKTQGKKKNNKLGGKERETWS